MKRYQAFYHAALLGVGLALAGCGTLGTFQKVATATVPANVVIPAATSFDVLKNAAANYAEYCISRQMAPAICAADTRRIVVKAVRVGTSSRDRLQDTVENGTPALASVYNLMVGAIGDLKNSPAASSQFTGIPVQ